MFVCLYFTGIVRWSRFPSFFSSSVTILAIYVVCYALVLVYMALLHVQVHMCGRIVLLRCYCTAGTCVQTESKIQACSIETVQCVLCI